MCGEDVRQVPSVRYMHGEGKSAARKNGTIRLWQVIIYLWQDTTNGSAKGWMSSQSDDDSLI